MHVLAQLTAEGAQFTRCADDGTPEEPAIPVATHEISDAVRILERDTPRWVWSDTRRWARVLLADGVRVERCLDLRLAHRILRRSTLVAGSALQTAPAGVWDAVVDPVRDQGSDAEPDVVLFDIAETDAPVGIGGDPIEQDAAAEWARQRDAIAGAAEPGRLRLLISAESAGALVAEELWAVGLPWSVERHDALLTATLGPRPAIGQRPAELERLLGEIRAWLEDPTANPDSPPELLKALHRAGIVVESTRKWDLERIEHPVIAPLLDYKRRQRLLTANGWAWLDEWVHDSRFRPEYVVGGVVTGRWATNGGGAMQLPKELRGAVVADPGWKLVVADVAQLEPRILAAMSGDLAMMRAGAVDDMYQAIVDTGAVETRQHAKIGMLGALYGGTTGESGRMLPRLTKAFPAAIAYVEEAAQAGERGESVSTWLGRSSPKPGDASAALDAAAYDDELGDSGAGRRAVSNARAWGRFTRNFVVQGTAAEWAEAWMAGLRRRLDAIARAALEEGEEVFWPDEAPHLCYFLHDEVVVHTPAESASRVADAVVAAADEAGRLLFGDRPVRFPLDVHIVDSFDQAD